MFCRRYALAMALSILSNGTSLLAGDRGVLLEYAYCACSPAAKTTETLYCKYLVTRDTWILQTTGYSPHWTSISLWPYPADFRFTSKPGEVETQEVRSELALRIDMDDVLNKGTIDQSSLNGLCFVRPRSELWSMSEEDLEHTSKTIRDGNRWTRHITGPIEADTEIRVRRGSGEWTVEQTLAGDFRHLWFQRRFSYPENGTSERITTLPSSGMLTFSNGRFLRLDSRFEIPSVVAEAPRLSTEQREQLSKLSPMGKGGRWIEFAWKDLEEVSVPERIDVSLGVQAGGMFLRTTRLLRARLLTEAEVVKELDTIQGTMPGQHRISKLINHVTEACWGRDLRNAGGEAREKLMELTRQLQAITKSPDTLGERHMAEQQLALIAISSEPVNSPVLRSRLETHFDQLATEVCPQSALASLFGLQEALYEWKRYDLLPLTWDLAQEHMKRLPLERRLFLLIGMIHRLEADDLHASLLLDAISSAESDFSDPRLLRAAILQVFRLLERDRLNHPEGKPWARPKGLIDRFLSILANQQSSSDEMLRAVSEDIAKRIQAGPNAQR